jgi:hypothetical protein
MSKSFIPRNYLRKKLIVPENVFQNLLWLKENGLGLSSYRDVEDLPYPDNKEEAFRQNERNKREKELRDLKRNLKEEEDWYAEFGKGAPIKEAWMLQDGKIDPLLEQNRRESELNQKVYKDRIAEIEMLNQLDDAIDSVTEPSGLGDNAGLDSSNVYKVPEYLMLWGSDPEKLSKVELRKAVAEKLKDLELYETALKKLDKGYTGRTIHVNKPGLIDELQQTIAEQEKEILSLEKELSKLIRENKKRGQ